MMYVYDPLPKHSIRVAELLPGPFEDDLVILLHTEFFDPTADPPSTPTYEALSYTWGSNDDPSVVCIGDRLGDELRITRNLDVALRNLRYRFRSRILWVDAICMNQSDAEEKGPQVAMMGNIYRFAERVVAWLGPAENDSDRALQLMEGIGNEVEVDFATAVMTTSATAQDHSLVDTQTPLLLNGTELEAIYHLFCRPWFERLWVRQEIHLANHTAIVVCGSEYISWRVFRRAWACLYWKDFYEFRYAEQWQARKILLSGACLQSRGFLFPNLRHKLGAIAECADPRDRIFAMLSLDVNADYLDIVPNYTLDTAKVYEGVALRCIECFQNLDILTQCEMSLGSVVIEVPSWVPDWSILYPYSIRWSIDLEYACGPFFCPSRLLDTNQLQVLAVPIDIIQNYRITVIENPASMRRNTVQANIKRLISDQDLSKDYIDGASLLEAYVEIMSLGAFAESYGPTHQGFASFREAIGNISNLLNSTNGDPIDAKFLFRARDVLRNRLLLETKRGYIGLGTQSVILGDEVHVVIGCRSPLILRPMKDGSYKIVGPCFVAGLNYGEALLGPLPKDWRRVLCYDQEAGGFYPRFVHENTGETCKDDPRLSEWFAGDHKRAGQKELFNDGFFVDADYLKDHGIEARYINIA